jgi:hypothetical protein
MTTDTEDREPVHAASPTARVLDQLQLHGYKPRPGEPDPRPLPEDETIDGAVAGIFDALTGTLADTPLDADLEVLLWSTVNGFHRAAATLQRALDANEEAQKRGQKEQDGSEIRSVELERLIGEGTALIERRDCLEQFRDAAATRFEEQTGSPWRPRAGSSVTHRTALRPLHASSSRHAALSSGPCAPPLDKSQNENCWRSFVYLSIFRIF